MSDDWDQRLLCPDGGCVGLIGNDGTCKVCGRAAPNWGSERTRGLRADEEVAPEVEAHAVATDLPAADPEFEDRALCPDGACIGVIGVDGTCKVCGRAAGDSPDDDDLDDDDLDDEEYDDEDDDGGDVDDDDPDDARDDDAPARKESP